MCSIKKIARIGGVLYLILILVGMFAVLFVRDKLIVSGDVMKPKGNALNFFSIPVQAWLAHTNRLPGLRK